MRGILVRFGWKMVEIMEIIVSHEIASGGLSVLPWFETNVESLFLMKTVDSAVD